MEVGLLRKQLPDGVSVSEADGDSPIFPAACAAVRSCKFPVTSGGGNIGIIASVHTDFGMDSLALNTVFGR